MCPVFGCAEWEVEDLIHKWVRLWDAKVSGMNECPRSASHDAPWSSGYVPNRDRYGGYLGWHGLMLAAGEMLATRVVTGQDWGGDAWDAFLAEYQNTRPDGLWLADATDLFPLDLPSELALAIPDPGERSRPAGDYRLLAPLLGIDEKHLTGNWMPVAGHWSITNDLDVAMRNVLANARDARNTVMAVLADEPSARWLPDDQEEISRLFGDDGHSVRAWIERDQHSERKFDRQDPYAATSAHQRPRPAAWVRDALALTPDDAIPRSWSRGQRLAFQAEAWGAKGGRGEHAWEISGARLLGNREIILDLLEQRELQLVGLLKLQRYNRGESSGHLGDTRAFSNRTLIFSLDAQGRIWAPSTMSRVARQAIASIDPDYRRELHALFKAFATLPQPAGRSRTSPPIGAVKAYPNSKRKNRPG